jgi:hypothetical protein
LKRQGICDAVLADCLAPASSKGCLKPIGEGQIESGYRTNWPRNSTLGHPWPGYSTRSARAGSIEEARRAGIRPANVAAATRTKMDPIRTAESRPLTS